MWKRRKRAAERESLKDAWKTANPPGDRTVSREKLIKQDEVRGPYEKRGGAA